MHKPLSNCGNTPGQKPLTLVLGKGKSGIGLAANHIDDRFSLNQVEPAIEKSALGELSRLGGTSSLPYDQVEQPLNNKVPAMALDLYHVLTGIAAGPLHQNKKDFVQKMQVAGSTISP